MRPASIHIRDGASSRFVAPRAVRRRPRRSTPASCVVLPGLVDTHVHINDPGRDRLGRLRARDAGGGGRRRHDARGHAAQQHSADDDRRRRSKRKRARRGGAVSRRRRVLGRRRARQRRGRSSRSPAPACSGSSAFSVPSGVDEFQHVTEADLREALPVLARLGLPLLAHAELPATLREPARRRILATYATWLASRPPDGEHAAIELLIRLAREYRRARAHRPSRVGRTRCRARRRARRGVADHRRDLPALPDVRRRGDPRRRDGVQVRAADPRARSSRRPLEGALSDGAIDLVATDHSPAPPALKRLDDGDFCCSVGRHRVAADRAAGGVDRRRGARRADRTRRAMARRARRGSRASSIRRDRSRSGATRTRHLGSGRGARRRSFDALPSSSRDAIRGHVGSAGACSRRFCRGRDRLR